MMINEAINIQKKQKKKNQDEQLGNQLFIMSSEEHQAIEKLALKNLMKGGSVMQLVQKERM